MKIRRRNIAISVALIVFGLTMLNLKSVIRGLTTNVAELDKHHDDPELRPISIGSSPIDVADRISQWVAQRSGWAVESRDTEGENISMHLTRATRVFQFVDDIHVTLVSENGDTRVQAVSRSRIGKGDLGQNARNLKELIAALR